MDANEDRGEAKSGRLCQKKNVVVVAAAAVAGRGRQRAAERSFSPRSPGLFSVAFLGERSTLGREASFFFTFDLRPLMFVTWPSEMVSREALGVLDFPRLTEELILLSLDSFFTLLGVAG